MPVFWELLDRQPIPKRYYELEQGSMMSLAASEVTKLTIQILLPDLNVNFLHSVLIIWNHGLIYLIIWLCMHNSGCFISDVSFELRDWSLIARAIDKGWKEVPVRLFPVNIYISYITEMPWPLQRVCYKISVCNLNQVTWYIFWTELIKKLTLLAHVVRLWEWIGG